MLFRNTFAVTAALITGYVFSFIVAPVMLSRLGLAQFGVWAVTGAVATYAGLMDLGITRGLGRFVAFYHASDDRRAVEQCYTLGLIAVTFVGIIAGTGGFFAAPILADALDGVLNDGDMRVVLLSSVAIGVLNAFRFVMKVVPEGMEQFVPPSLAEICFNVVSFVLSIGALILSKDLVVYALANVAAGLAGLGFAYIALRRVVGPHRLRLPPKPLIKEVLSFSVQTQVSWIGDLSTGQAAKVIIAIFLDVRLAGAYEIASRAVLAAKSVAVMSLAAMVPAATARIVNEGRGVIAEFYRRYNERAMSVSLPLLFFLCASAPALLVAWLGKVPDDSLALFIVLTVANCLNLTTGVAFALSLSEGRAGMIAIVSGFTAVVTIAGMLALTPPFGLWGAAAGNVIGVVAGALVYLVYFHRIHGLPAREYFSSIGPAALAALAPAVPIALSWLFISAPVGRPTAALISAADLAVYLAIYLPLGERLDLLPQRLRPSDLRRALSAYRRRRADPAGVV